MSDFSWLDWFPARIALRVGARVYVPVAYCLGIVVFCLDLALFCIGFAWLLVD